MKTIDLDQPIKRPPIPFGRYLALISARAGLQLEVLERTEIAVQNIRSICKFYLMLSLVGFGLGVALAITCIGMGLTGR